MNSLVAQAIALVSMLFITHLYGPEQFSIYILYSNLFIWLGPILCLKYDVAIVVAKNMTEAINLLVISILITLVISVISLCVILGMMNLGFLSYSQTSTLTWILFTPIGIILTGTALSMRSLLHFQKEYFSFSSTPVIFSSIYGLSSIIMYTIWPSGIALVLSQIIGTLSVCIFVSKKLDLKVYFSSVISVTDLKKTARTRIHYPLISSPSSLLDGVSQAMPIYFIAIIYNSVAIASYGIMIKIVIAPIRFIFTSIATLMLKIIHDEIIDGNPIEVFWKVSCGLFIIVCLISLVLTNYAAPIVDLVLNSEWSQTVMVVEKMCFAALFSAAVSSLSNIFAATNRLLFAAIWQVIYFTVTLAFFLYIMNVKAIPLTQFFELLAIKEVSLYSIYFVLIAISIYKPKVT